MLISLNPTVASASATDFQVIETQSADTPAVVEPQESIPAPGQTSAPPPPELRLERARLQEAEGNTDLSLEARQSTYNELLSRVTGLRVQDPRRQDAVRLFIDNAYRLAWSRYDQGDTAAGNAIERDMANLLQRYDLPTPRGGWALPLAQWRWLRARVAADAGDTTGDQADRVRVEVLSREADANPDDFVALSRFRLRFLDYTRKTEEENTRFCDYVAQLDAQFANFDTFRTEMLNCDLEKILMLRNQNKLIEAFDLLQPLYDRIELLRNENDFNKFALLLVKIRSEQGYIANLLGRKRDSVNFYRQASADFSRIMNGSSYYLTFTNELQSAFDLFANTDLSSSPQFANSTDRNRELVRMFSQVATALDRTMATYPNSSDVASTAADARSRAAFALMALGRWTEARSEAERALSSIEPFLVLEGNGPYTDRAVSQCRILELANRIAVNQQDTASVLSTYQRINAQCGAWLRRFPWDLYARQQLVQAATRSGTYLSSIGQISDAQPMLRMASNWGSSSASFELAQILRNENSGFYDLDAARAVHSLSLRQTHRAIDVAATSAEGSTYLYAASLFQFGSVERCPIQDLPLPPDLECAGFPGIDGPVKWLQVARSGRVGDAQTAAFRQIEALPALREFSYPDAVFAALRRQSANNAGNTNQRLVYSGFILAAPMKPTDIMDLRRTNEISRSSSASCIIWNLSVVSQPGEINVREEYILPDYPAMPHQVGPQSTILDGGRKIATTLSLSTANGLLQNGLCAGPGDPLGTYRFDIYEGESLLGSLSFDLVE